jgi:hypothetical protein
MSDCIERKKGTIHPTPGLPKFGILSGNIKELFVEGKERSFNCAMNIQIYAIHVNVYTKIGQFNTTTFLCLSQDRTLISNVICRGLFWRSVSEGE